MKIGIYIVKKALFSFYDKFDIEFLKFKAEMENQISNFVEEKQFSDLDKLLLNEYL